MIELLRKLLSIFTLEGVEPFIQFLGLIGLFLTALFTFKRLRAVEKQSTAMIDQVLISRESQIIEQFKTSVEQISNHSIEVRLGGIITLSRLSKNTSDLDFCKTILDLLCTYVKVNSAPERKFNESIFPDRVVTIDFFNRFPLPNELKHIQNIRGELLNLLLERGYINEKHEINYDTFNPFLKYKIDLEPLDVRNNILGSGIDWTEALYYFLQKNYYKQSNLKTDINYIINIIEYFCLTQSNWAFDISDTSFNNRNLNYLRLHNVKFDSSSFLGCDLSFSHFGSSSFERVDFQGAHIFCSSFEDCNLEQANFKFSSSSVPVRSSHYREKGINYLVDDFKSSFQDSILKYTDFRFSSLYKSNFDGSKHYDSQFGHCELSQSSFKNANLNSSQFGNTRAFDCNFQGSNITGVYFGNSDLKDSDFSKVKTEQINDKERHPFNTRFEGADLKNVTFDDAELYNVDFRGAKNLSIDQIIKAKIITGSQFDEAINIKLSEINTSLNKET